MLVSGSPCGDGCTVNSGTGSLPSGGRTGRVVLQAVLGLCRGQWRPGKGLTRSTVSRSVPGRTRGCSVEQGVPRSCPPDPPRPAPPPVADALIPLLAGGLVTELPVTALCAARLHAAQPLWARAGRSAFHACFPPAGVAVSPPCAVWEQVSEGRTLSTALQSLPVVTPSSSHMSDSSQCSSVPGRLFLLTPLLNVSLHGTRPLSCWGP